MADDGSHTWVIICLRLSFRCCILCFKLVPVALTDVLTLFSLHNAKV